MRKCTNTATTRDATKHGHLPYSFLDTSGYMGPVTASLLCFLICSEISLGGEDFDPRGDVLWAEGTTYGQQSEVPGLAISQSCTSRDSMCPQ